MSFIYLPFFFVFFLFFEKLWFYVASKQENTYTMVSPNQSMLLANSYGNGVKLELKSKPITIKKKWRKPSVFTKKNYLKDDIKLNHSFPKNKMKKTTRSDSSVKEGSNQVETEYLERKFPLNQEIPFEDIVPIEDDIDRSSEWFSSDKLYQFCKSVAINHTIMTTMTDSGYLDLFYIFYTNSHLEHYKNFFVTALDEKAYEELRARNITAFLFKANDVEVSSLHQSSIITSIEFQKKVVNKLQYIEKLLKFRFRVLYMDCDIILFQNPWKVLNTYSHHTCDIVAQKDTTLNSGFMYIFPSDATIDLMRHSYYHMLRNDELDQESIIAVLPRFSSIRLSLLPEDQFSNGRVFFHKHQFSWDALFPNEYMMHNNYIVGSSNKFYRFRELGMTENDKDEYYTSTDRKYLMVDAMDERIETTTYLRQVAYVAVVLNRTFLLPTFPCPSSFIVKRCHLCRDDVECYKSFRKMIHENYRDYTFRNASLTSISIKEAIQKDPVYSVEVTKNESLLHSNSINSSIIYLPSKISKKSLADAFSSFSNVLVLKLADIPLSMPKRF